MQEILEYVHKIMNVTPLSYFFVSKKIMRPRNSLYESHFDILQKYFETHPINHVFVCNPNYNTIFNLQIVVYLEFLEVWGRENDWGGVLWVLYNIKLSVTTSCVMGKCGTGVFMSVFCDASESMEFRHD